jgi:hypothetical protein
MITGKDGIVHAFVVVCWLVDQCVALHLYTVNSSGKYIFISLLYTKATDPTTHYLVDFVDTCLPDVRVLIDLVLAECHYLPLICQIGSCAHHMMRNIQCAGHCPQPVLPHIMSIKVVNVGKEYNPLEVDTPFGKQFFH